MDLLVGRLPILKMKGLIYLKKFLSSIFALLVLFASAAPSVFAQSDLLIEKNNAIASSSQNSSIVINSDRKYVEITKTFPRGAGFEPTYYYEDGTYAGTLKMVGMWVIDNVATVTYAGYIYVF